jgi:subtilisin family serine protease
VDDIRGWDFLDDDNDPMPDAGDDHGTHVAGTIGAAGNNGLGVTGINWNVKLMALKRLGANGGPVSTSVEGHPLLAPDGREVSNNSYGGSAPRRRDAGHRRRPGGRAYLRRRRRQRREEQRHHPLLADQLLPPVRQRGERGRHRRERPLTDFSNFGRDSVTVAAPGVGILSTFPGGGYDCPHGTSWPPRT